MNARSRQGTGHGNHRRRLRLEPLEQRQLLSAKNAEPFDINAMLDAGTASVTSAPIDIGSLINVFDGNTGTLARSASVNPAYVQVAFTGPRTLKEFRAWFSHTWGDPSHQWMIETADTQVDMDLKIGSHATIVPWTGTPSDQYSVATLEEPVRTKLVRLTVERLTGDNYVHINEWSIYGGATMAALEVRPASATLEQYDQFQFDTVGIDSDGWEHDLTDQVQWSILDPDVATVDTGGVVTAMMPGNTQVIAAVDALSASAQLDVVPRVAGPVDLNATFIERTPRYDYDAPKNNPERGDLVTFGGHVRCWGDFVPEVEYRWTIDGVTVESGTLTDLIPGQDRVVEYAWNWLDGNHTVEFTIDPAGQITETSEANNVVEDRTNGLAVGFWVEESVHAYFHEYQHELGIGSNSWEDWTQRQMARWNEHCENAVYPTSPQGVLDRVRIDKIVVVPDGALPLAGGLPGNHPDRNDKTVDLMWGFPATLLDGSMYTDHTNLWEGNAFYLEGSLIHELGHARYLIDNYGYDVANNDSVQQVQIYEDGQPVAGSEWMPFLAWDSVLYYNQNGGIMTGPWRAWSPYGAAALNLIAGQRASQGNYNAPGNIGVFLQDLPENNHVRFVDTGGQPLAGANVRVYQAEPGPGWYGKVIDNTYELPYTTDADGYVHMPRNPFADGPIVHTYGRANGIAVLRIEHGDDLWYRFMEVPDFNLQYWQGNTEDAYYTFELPQRGSPAEIEVRGYGQVIVDGDTTPDPADHTDFGRLALDGSSRTRQFVVKNRGGTDLQLTGSRVIVSGTHAADFQLLNKPGYHITPETISTFQVQFTPGGPGVRRATVSIMSDDANENPYTFEIQGVGGVAEIVDRRVFYANSAFDDGLPLDAGDDRAVAYDKFALLPGQMAGFGNYTSYDRGLNGLVVDVAGLPPAVGAIDPSEYFAFRTGNGDDVAAWQPYTAAPLVAIRAGQGKNGSDRITITWPDYDPAEPETTAAAGRWLEVTMRATDATGLTDPDVFYFGNATGEAGNSTCDAKVNAFDMLAARNNQRTFLDPAPVDFPFDYNRDQRVNVFDMLIARNNATHFLNALELITVPAGKSGMATDEVGVKTQVVRDVALEQASEQESEWREPLAGKLEWLHEFEQMRPETRSSDEHTSAEDLVDQLLATWGP